MSNIYDLIYNALSESGYPVYKINSYAEGIDAQETFLAYMVVSSPNTTHYDNRPASTTYRVQITLYSKKPQIVQTADELIKSLMLPKGFLRMGGRDLPVDSDTGHEAFTSDYSYFKYEENDTWQELISAKPTPK